MTKANGPWRQILLPKCIIELLGANFENNRAIHQND